MTEPVKLWRCENCETLFDDDPGVAHAVEDHDPVCDGSCKYCPVEIPCGPIEELDCYPAVDSDAPARRVAGELRNELELREWDEVGNYGMTAECSSCGNSSRQGHADHCSLRALLERARGEAQDGE